MICFVFLLSKEEANLFMVEVTTDDGKRFSVRPEDLHPSQINGVIPGPVQEQMKEDSPEMRVAKLLAPLAEEGFKVISVRRHRPWYTRLFRRV